MTLHCFLHLSTIVILSVPPYEFLCVLLSAGGPVLLCVDCRPGLGDISIPDSVHRQVSLTFSKAGFVSFCWPWATYNLQDSTALSYRRKSFVCQEDILNRCSHHDYAKKGILVSFLKKMTSLTCRQHFQKSLAED